MTNLFIFWNLFFSSCIDRLWPKETFLNKYFGEHHAHLHFALTGSTSRLDMLVSLKKSEWMLFLNEINLLSKYWQIQRTTMKKKGFNNTVLHQEKMLLIITASIVKYIVHIGIVLCDVKSQITAATSVNCTMPVSIPGVKLWRKRRGAQWTALYCACSVKLPGNQLVHHFNCKTLHRWRYWSDFNVSKFCSFLLYITLAFWYFHFWHNYLQATHLSK